MSILAICFAMQMRKIISSKEIGEKIKFRRQELGISQERLAEILDVSYQQVQRYENGSNKLNVENIQIIANALDIAAASFFTGNFPHMVADESPSYIPTEEKTLLKHFRKISDKSGRLAVISVARLAAKK